MNKQLMVDFESWGLGSNAVLLSLGAVHFCPVTGEIHSQFFAHIDPRLQPGRDIDPSTVLWWLKQEDAARAVITTSIEAADVIDAGFDEDSSDEEISAAHQAAAFPINQVAQAFIAWTESLGGDLEVWTNGAVDHAWLESMMTYSGYKNPIKFWLQRDYRTMKALYPQVPLERTGTLHNALDDAITQAKHLAAIFSHIHSADPELPKPVLEYLTNQQVQDNAVVLDSRYADSGDVAQVETGFYGEDPALAAEASFSADDIQQVINEDNAAQQAQAIGQQPDDTQPLHDKRLG